MKLTFIAFFLFISTLSFSQLKTEAIDHVIDSNIYEGKRTISVFLPSSYNSENSIENFAVAYLFDAQFEPYFSMVSSIMSYYEQTNEGVPMIIVGIHTSNRWGEFGPVYKEDKNEQNKGADKLTEFLAKEVIPFVEEKYRTKSFKVGVGHSLGGTYVINEVTKENSIFNAVIAASPNLTVYNEQIVAQAVDYYTNSPSNSRFLYTSVGTEGEMEQNFKKSLLHLDSITAEKSLKNMTWKCDILKGENHMTTFVPTFNKGYLSLSSKLRLMDKELVKLADNPEYKMEDDLVRFYKELSLFNGEKNELTIDRVMAHAFKLSQYKKYTASIELFHFSDRMLEESEKSLEEKNKFKEKIKKQLLRGEFNLLVQKAKQFSEINNYKKASEIYIQAFKMDVVRATHVERMTAVSVFAQAGKVEEAFVQLDLLANYFKLQGNSMFVNDPLCKPLHSNSKWEDLMKVLVKNSEL